MNETKNIQSKYQSISKFILLWLVIWYLIGFLYMFISVLPSVSIWSIQESITYEGNFLIGSSDIESGSIVHALFFSATWPILCGFFFTVGLLIGGEFVGYEYSSNLPILIILYYIKVIQLYLPVFVIGFISGIITLILAKNRIIRTYLS